ncbi:MAG: hypothetical protein V1774_03110 [Candidatus Eisenbacteria bacterium]
MDRSRAALLRRVTGRRIPRDSEAIIRDSLFLEPQVRQTEGGGACPRMLAARIS